LALGAGLVLAWAMPAFAVAFNVNITSTGPTTQPSGSTFTYQINLACSGTNAPTCNDAVVTIPLDSVPDMVDWDFDVSGGPAGFIQSWEVDDATQTLVIRLADSVPAGSSQSIILSVTPPNLTTPDGTSWDLLPSVTSTDPDMTDTTAPNPASGTATATVPLTVSKTSDRSFYAEGETITYTLRATCPSSKPVGSVYADSMTVSDVLPAGLNFVSATPAQTSYNATTGELTWVYPNAASVPVACGGTAPAAAPETITVTATVGTVGSDASDDFDPYQNVPNTVTATATPVGGGDDATASGTRTVVMLADDDPAIPGTHSIGKSSSAPLNRAPSGTDYRATYPGRWLPNGDNSTRPASVLDAAPATYTISPRIQYEGFQAEIHDKLPCLADLNTTTGVYTQSAGVCAAPAFHVLGIRIDYSGAAAPAGYAPQYVRTNGTTGTMTFETSGSGWAGWIVPTADLGHVAEIIIPRDDSQENRRSDNIRVYGYADASTQDGQTLQNRASVDWYLGDAATATDSQTSGTADIFVINAPQIGIAKDMTDVSGVTGPQARVQLTATLFSPGVPTADLVVADLLPAGTTLVTDPATITAQLARPGGTTINLTAADLDIEVIANFAPGQQLIRVTLPVAELPAAAGKYTLTLSQLTVDKPTEPGTYTNTAHVFYDDPDLSHSCAAGSFNPDDAANLRGDAAAEPGSCEASDTFQYATSSSGQFLLTKTVQGDYDTSPQAFPAVGHVKLTDGVADYAINWQNTGAPTLNGVVLYDVFPHIGDTGVSGAQATEQRDSAFQPLLASVGTPPAGVTIAYSASADACRPEVYPGQGACVNDWTTDPATLGGLANVMAIRLVSTDSYPTGEGFSLGFQMSVPTVDKDKIAWNSVAAFAQTVGGTALLPTESPKVGITASDDRFTIDKVVNAANAVPGDTLTYTVTVGNTGTRASVPTTVVDEVPAGVSFVSADHGGSYDPATRKVTWDIPALDRDATLVLTVTVTVDTQQDDDKIVNRATIVNPAGYSPPIVADPCADDPTKSCATTTVPPTPTPTPTTTPTATPTSSPSPPGHGTGNGDENENGSLPSTGAPWSAALLLGGLLALIVGATLLVALRRRRLEV
jgi:uncharacterized repeat protein (TIGR01451 family)/LPXTG-motif cell wall-anchored protein